MAELSFAQILVGGGLVVLTILSFVSVDLYKSILRTIN